MKCQACGREMLRRGTYFECVNVLCDYEEDIETVGVFVDSREDSPVLIFDEPATLFS